MEHTKKDKFVVIVGVVVIVKKWMQSRIAIVKVVVIVVVNCRIFIIVVLVVPFIVIIKKWRQIRIIIVVAVNDSLVVIPILQQIDNIVMVVWIHHYSLRQHILVRIVRIGLKYCYIQ